MLFELDRGPIGFGMLFHGGERFLHDAKDCAFEHWLESVEPDSPAADAGIRSGDIIGQVDEKSVVRALDLERVFLGSEPGRDFEVEVVRKGEPLQLRMTLAARPGRTKGHVDRTWQVVGLRLKPVPRSRIGKGQSRYRGGLLVTSVRADSPASDQGIKPGDILVGMHIWETVSEENVSYVLNHGNRADFDPLKFYIVRGNQTLYGHMRIASLQASRSSSH